VSEKSGPRLVGTYLIDPEKLHDTQILVERVESAAIVSAKNPEAVHVVPSKHAVEKSHPSVRLVETDVSVAPAGSWYAVTKFHIAPCGLAQCVLQLPETQSLVKAELDGHEALVQPIDHQRWRVQLSEPTLPQTLEIAVRSLDRFDPDARAIDLHRPSLWSAEKELPIEVGLWTLNRPKSRSVPSAVAAAHVSLQEAAVLKLDRLSGIADSSIDAATAMPKADVRNWLLPRVQELLSAKEIVENGRNSAINLESMRAIVHSDDDPATLAIARSEAWIAKMEEYTTEPPNGIDLGKNATKTPHNDLSDEALPGCETTSFVSQGNGNRLKIEFVPLGLTAGETRASLTALIVGLAGIAIWVAGRPNAVSPD
jgi:hypothetical protein